MYLRWLLATMVGGTLGGAIIALQAYRGYYQTDDVAIGFALAGLVVGLAQWLALLSLPFVWIPANAVGFGLAVFSLNITLYFIDFQSNPLLSIFLGLLVGSFVVGSVQWLVLKQNFLFSNVWILATAIGLTLGIGVALAIATVVTNNLSSDLIGEYSARTTTGGAIGGSIGSFIYGIATAECLVWLLKQNQD